MPVKKYDRKNKKFYIIKPKLLHLGKLKDNKNSKDLSDEDKFKIYKNVNKIEHFGTEFGASVIVSFSKYDIFKIRDEVKNNTKLLNKKNIEKIKMKKNSRTIDLIRSQLGL